MTGCIGALRQWCSRCSMIVSNRCTLSIKAYAIMPNECLNNVGLPITVVTITAITQKSKSFAIGWRRKSLSSPFNSAGQQLLQVVIYSSLTSKCSQLLVRWPTPGFYRAPEVTRLFFWFLRKATAETRAPILTQNTSNDPVPRKEVPFGGRETKI